MSAMVLAGQGKFDDAVARFQDYLDVHADSQYRPQVLLLIGSVHETAASGMKDKEAREAEMKKSEEPREEAATLLRKSFDEELDTRKRVETGLGLSDVYSQLRQYDKAFAMLNTLRADSATSASQDLDATLTARESLIYQDQKEEAKAIEVLEKGIEAHSQETGDAAHAHDNARIILMSALSDLHINAHHYDLAKQTLEKMVAAFPNTKVSQQAGATLQQIDRVIEQEAAATTATAASAALTTDTAPRLPAAENPLAPAAPGNN
jgi:tetratricopeptide (TPR) repeat protein